MRCRIEKVVQGGAGLSSTAEGKRLFVSEALPSELVEVELEEEKADYAKARIVSILEANEHRIQPPCPFWGRCGGCDFQYAEPQYQAKVKEAIVLDNIERLGLIDRSSFTLENVEIGPAWEYRNRVRFHVDLARKQVGFLGRKTNTLLSLDHCPVLVPTLNALLKNPSVLFEAARSRMLSDKPGKGGYWEVPVFGTETGISVFGNEVLASVAGKKLAVTNEVFFQSNQVLVSSLVQYVRDQVIGNVVMDLYSGVGTFSSFLEQEGRSLIAVEQQKQCLALARKNAPSCQFYTDRVESWAQHGKKKTVDTVVVDPPRTGLDASLPSLLSSYNSKRIVYVSCNSVTLGRDLQRFASEGYTLTKVKVFDLYPQTFHHEVVAVLDRRENVR